VANSFDKKGFIENLEKVGRTVRGPLKSISNLRFLEKFFKKKSLPGGQSMGPRRTI
jgi:hypothetical protein